ncbi:MAG: pilus assembly PilX N-terminal domain-containing protein [Patescibacteria group bacterium]
MLNKKGNILLFVMVFGTIAFSIIVVGLAGYAISENRASLSKHNREVAFQIADAGINYYRWHLAHSQTDFYDGNGTSTPGPYVHAYSDKDGNVIGHFSLEIGPPPTGSTIVTVTSTGWLDIQPNTKRKIKVKLGFPALTDFAFLTGTDVWIGDDEVTHGKFHANGGIRFDGLGDAPITSAMATYTCKQYHGCGAGQVKPGIWGDGGPESYWDFPATAKDFTEVTADLAKIETNSDPDLGGLNFTPSGQQGWRLQFTSSSQGQVIVSKVLTTDCYKAKDVGDNNYFWPCIDISTQESYATYDMPSNGYIFVDDNVWVDGAVKGRVVVGTSVGKNIILNGDIIYAAKDGTDVLGLIADQNILIPHNSPDDLEIDAAVLAQNGAAKRYYYPGDMKTNLLIYGSVISMKIWTWSWVSGGGSITSGYRNTNSTYDANLTYGPPPGFPVGSQYNLISWQEVK